LNSTTRSSSESELVVLEEASTFAVWIRLLFSELKLNYNSSLPTIIYQDNMSTIVMASNGGSFKRTKHLLNKHSYVKERITNKEIILKYLPTGRMAADMLTKPVSHTLLTRFLTYFNIRK
jgi:hypothetical protein